MNPTEKLAKLQIAFDTNGYLPDSIAKLIELTDQHQFIIISAKHDGTSSNTLMRLLCLTAHANHQKKELSNSFSCAPLDSNNILSMASTAMSGIPSVGKLTGLDSPEDALTYIQYSMAKNGFPNLLQFLLRKDCLPGIAYLRQIPILCNECKIPYNSNKHSFINFLKSIWPSKQHKVPLMPINETQTYRKGKGCVFCGGYGLNGFLPIPETINCDHQYLDLMAKGQTQKAREYWLSNLNGLTSLQQAIDGIQKGRLDPIITQNLDIQPV